MFAESGRLGAGPGMGAVAERSAVSMRLMQSRIASPRDAVTLSAKGTDCLSGRDAPLEPRAPRPHLSTEPAIGGSAHEGSSEWPCDRRECRHRPKRRLPLSSPPPPA